MSSGPSDTDRKSTRLRFAVPIHSGNSLLNVLQNLNSYWEGQAWRTEDAINGRCGRIGIACEDFPCGGSREPKRSCPLMEVEDTHTPQRGLNFSHFDPLSRPRFCGGCRRWLPKATVGLRSFDFRPFVGFVDSLAPGAAPHPPPGTPPWPRRGYRPPRRRWCR